MSTETLFSLVAGGVTKIRRVQFTTISGVAATCGVRILLDGDDDAVETAARKAAIDRGVADPKPGEVIYDRWVRIFSLLFACVSVPDDPAAPVPVDPPLFFDGGVEQIQKHLDRERIAYLFAMQAQWQALIAPRQKGMNRDQFVHAIFVHAMATAGAEELPFWSWHPALQESWLISTACLALGSPAIRSASGSPSEGSSSTSSPSEAGGNLTREAALRLIDAALLKGEARVDGLGVGPVHETELAEHEAHRTGSGPAPARKGPARQKPKPKRRR